MAKKDSFTELTVSGGEGIGVPDTSSSVALGFGSWRVPSADRPVLVQVSILAQTDGTTSGEVKVDVDESGGTTADYSLSGAFVGSTAGAGASSENSTMFLIPPGGSYRYRNVGDPNTANSVQTQREFEL